MAKFTKTNKAIHHDGIVEFTDNQSMGGTTPTNGNRVTNAAPAVDDNDYVIKSQVLTRISEDTTFYVRSTGSDSNDGLTELTAWAHPQYAANIVANYVIDEGKTLTVDIGKGIFTGIGGSTESVLSITNKQFNNIIFKGTVSEETIDIIGINVSGTSVVLSVDNDVASLDITINESFFVFSFSGQTQTPMQGVYKITNKNTVSNTITLSFVGYSGVSVTKPTNVSVGASVLGTGYILHTVFQISVSSGIHCCHITNSIITIQNICMNNTAVPAAPSIGVYSYSGSSVVISNCGIVNFLEGVRTAVGSVLNYDSIVVSACNVGVFSLNASAIIGAFLSVTGCAIGIYAELSSNIWINGGRFINCTDLISAIRNSSINIRPTSTSIYQVTYAYCTRRAVADYISLVKRPSTGTYVGETSVGTGDDVSSANFSIIDVVAPTA